MKRLWKVDYVFEEYDVLREFMKDVESSWGAQPNSVWIESSAKGIPRSNITRLSK